MAAHCCFWGFITVLPQSLPQDGVGHHVEGAGGSSPLLPGKLPVQQQLPL